MKSIQLWTRRHFQLFDKTGLSKDQVRLLNVFIYAIMGGVVFGNITTGVAMASYMGALGASDSLYGFVMALPPLANAFQFLVSYWMEKTHKRRALFMVSGLIQRALWVPFALVPLMIPLSQPQLRLWTAVILTVVSACMSPVMNVSFFSLFNDSVPIRIRGRYLATRSRISTVVGFVMGLVTGVLLDALPPFTNYVVVFGLGAVFGLFDMCCYFFTKFPDMKASGAAPDNMFRMLKCVLSDKKYMRIVITLTCWFFAVQVASPFFPKFSRDIMHMSNLETIISGQVIYSLMLIFVVTRWGRAMDEYGNKPVLVIAALITSFVPAFWIRIGPGMFFLALASNALSGLTYCAVDLGAQNLFMSQAPEKNRSMYFAVYFIFTQLLGLALGSAVGGFLLDTALSPVDALGIVLSGVPFTRYNALFVLSFILRLTTVLGLLTTMKTDSPRHTKEMLQAMARAPRKGYRQLAYGIKRWHLRKQYDMTAKEE